MKKLAFTYGLLACAALLSGCSVGYDILQDRSRDACDKIMDYSERKACLQRNSETYEQYEKKRQKLQDEKSR